MGLGLGQYKSERAIAGSLILPVLSALSLTLGSGSEYDGRRPRDGSGVGLDLR